VELVGEAGGPGVVGAVVQVLAAAASPAVEELVAGRLGVELSAAEELAVVS
jgi:hypothetical protein